MKRNLLVLAVMLVVSLFFIPHLAGALTHCDQDTNDLGICDTLHVETFDCDHIYNATGGYDSVRVAIYVTHDSNTFWWNGWNRWVQDSIASFVVPLNFWKLGCADSVILPKYGNWNNAKMSRTHAQFKRSMFRDLVNPHTGEIDSNRFADMNELGYDDWTVITDVVSHDPGHSFVVMIPTAANCLQWWEGSRVLLAALSFLVYMKPNCNSTAICLDSTVWPPVNNRLTFTRHDAVDYIPRHFLPVCDTIRAPIRGDANGDGVINSADIVYLINYQFIGGPPPVPLEAGDANCDGVVNSADIVYLINYQFVGGPPPGCK